MQRPQPRPALPRPAVPTELLLIRHAPAATGGRLAGRRDVPLAALDPSCLPAARLLLGSPARILSSPALRCRQTAAYLFSDRVPDTDDRLWEQDFGDWDGLEPSQIPDLGPLPRAALAAHRPPEGESFDDLFARTAPALQAIAADEGPVAVIAHAGTIRAALSLAIGVPDAGLAFVIAPLSLTRLIALPDGSWSIGCVNQPL